MRTFSCTLFLILALAASGRPFAAESLEVLGRALFFDTNLSEPRGQSCATCHDPARAFTDGRDNGVHGALSLGADGRSLADRNAPTLTYVALVPPFQVRNGEPSGGLFSDGRVATLRTQAVEPLLNPLEMGQPDKATLLARVAENPNYQTALRTLFSAATLTDPDRAMTAIATAIASFETSSTFSSFDSRYDRYLRGEYAMTRAEAIGRELFFSELINCGQCHLNEAGRTSPFETFTNHRYHNIGVPVNEQARRANRLGPGYQDPGLAGHPNVSDARQAGRFRVPTLRNVAVTAPYMHNGAFQSLETAVAFYAQYTLTNRPSAINPETGLPWRAAETPLTVDVDILSDGQPIDPRRVDHIVAFLKTLTDERYEHLLD